MNVLKVRVKTVKNGRVKWIGSCIYDTRVTMKEIMIERKTMADPIGENGKYVKMSEVIEFLIYDEGWKWVSSEMCVPEV